MSSPVPVPDDPGSADIVPFDQEAVVRSQDSLVCELRCLKARNRLLEQLCLALGDDNRYYASLSLGRYATDNEAFDHYVLNGGKKAFDQAHPIG